MNKFKVVLKSNKSFRDGKTLVVEADTCIAAVKQVIINEKCSLGCVKKVTSYH